MLDYNLRDITVIIDHKGRRGGLRAYIWQEGVAGSNLLTHAFTDIEAAQQEASVRIEQEFGHRVNIHWRIESWRIESDSDRAVQRQSPKKKRKAGEGQAALFGGAM